MLSGGTFASFAWLSQSERFQRKWPSLYAAVEDGRVDSQALRQLLVSQLPQKGICVFPLDGSSWPRPRSRVLADLQNVYQASSDVDGGNITVVNRWPIEPGMRFRKETLPRLQSAETGDTWTLLVALAHWMLFLARPLVGTTRCPGKKHKRV